MGFDIECIIDIHTYPGEYFCPVCRTLVYPNEAYQSQCTHLYCKPCLAHIANGSRACPYDGYLVTESDSKALMDSDKALAENIGKVKVHCLYFRSGCTWEGTLSDCTSHCAGCSFGNSPVICNRCGIQIVHRQVHEHAHSCPGVYEGQQAVGGVSGLTRLGSTTSAATVEVEQTVAQSGPPLSQTQNPQNVAATLNPGQNSNLQAHANPPAPIVAPVAVAMPDQWYQQQYHQYYQHYLGYDPYQQPNQQYYQVPQQPFQQYPQHQVPVQGQNQSHVYSQAAPQLQPQLPPPPPPPSQHPQLQAQSQHNPVSQASQLSHFQPQSQGLVQPQTQQQVRPQAQPIVQVPPQVQAQGHMSVQAVVPNYQVNPQQPPHAPVRPQTQITPQAPPPPQSQSAQPPSYGQVMGMRPPAQNPQVPQYQQPHAQMPNHQPPQAHVATQPQSQTLSHTQSSNQPHIQPQPYITHTQPPIFPPIANQSTAPASLPQASQPPVTPVSGHHSYQQPQPAQIMQPAASQPHPGHLHSANVSMHPVQVHGQVPQLPAVMRPPHSHTSMPQQQPSTLLPLPNQVPGLPPTQHQPYPPQAQQPSQPIQQRPAMQPVQQAVSQQYAQQKPLLTPVQSQLHLQGHLPQQLMQPQLHPSGPPQLQQSHNYVGRPIIPNQGLQPQSQPSASVVGPLAHSEPVQSFNQNYAKPTVLELNATVQETRSAAKGLVEKGFEGEILKEEVMRGENETVVNKTDAVQLDGLNKSVKLEEGDVQGSLGPLSCGKSFDAGAATGEFSKEGCHLRDDSDSLKQVDLENQKMKLSETLVAGPSSANYDRQSHMTVSASGTEGYALPQKSYGSNQQKPEAQVPLQPPSVIGPQGPGMLPHHPGQSLNPAEVRGPGYFGAPPRSFESQSTLHGAALTAAANSHGIIGRTPPVRFEGNHGPQHVMPSEVVMSRDLMSGAAKISSSIEGVPHMKNRADEPSFFKMNGGTAPGPMFGSRDEKLKGLTKEHSNPFPGEPTHLLDQASRSLDRAPHGSSHEAGSKFDPGTLGANPRFLPPHHVSGAVTQPDMFERGPEFGQHHMKHLAHRSPDREYFGSSPHRFGGPANFPHGEFSKFGEGSRPFNLSSDRVGNPFYDGRFPPLPGYPHGGDIDGPGHPRFGERMAPGLIHNNNGSDDVFGPEVPGHLGRGKFLSRGYLPGHFSMADSSGLGSFPGHGHGHGHPGELGGPGTFTRLPFNESVRGDGPSFSHFGEGPMRNNYPLPGIPNAGNSTGGMDSFESRKRKPGSNAFCRLCCVDCDSAEGLDLHSQTREHQKVAMDMVKTIKQNNKKKQRTGGQVAHEGGSRNRKASNAGRGSKH